MSYWFDLNEKKKKISKNTKKNLHHPNLSFGFVVVYVEIFIIVHQLYFFLLLPFFMQFISSKQKNIIAQNHHL